MLRLRIYIGSDHAGFKLKEKLVPFLQGLGYEVMDKGAFELNENDDFPDFIGPVAKEVVKDEGSVGIVLGGSGQGEAMAANRHKGIRASVYYGGDLSVVSETREDNDSNILSIGTRFATEDETKEAIKLWLKTEFSTDPKYARRNKKLDYLS